MSIVTVEAAKSPLAKSEPFLFWLADHGVLVKDCYKVEIDLDAATMTIYEYKVNERGKKFMEFGEGKGGEIAVKPPRTVDIKNKPPIAIGE